MAATVIVDALYGDSGKGKIGAYLALKRRFEYSVEAGTGPSACHEFVLDGKRTVLTRHVPGGWLAAHTKLRIGPHVLIRLPQLRTELEELSEWNAASRLAIDQRCGIVQDANIEDEGADPLFVKDLAFEAGTTGARVDYLWRRSQRAKDVDELGVATTDVARELNEAAGRGANILVHGAHGTLLSLYLGDDYPWTCSDDCTAGAALVQVGLAWRHLTEVLMVVKALPTRTSLGALPHEMAPDEIGARGLISYGRVSGRPRRVARAIDRDLLTYSCLLNQPTALAIGCADHLDPRVSGATASSGLTCEVRSLIRQLEEWCGVPVHYVSTGPGVNDIVDLSDDD
jgi:adenylosuccinate synthase